MSSLFGILTSLSFLFSCTALGMTEVVPGTDKSDAVCAERKISEQPEDGMYLMEIIHYKVPGKKDVVTRVFGWLNCIPVVLDSRRSSCRPRLVSLSLGKSCF